MAAHFDYDYEHEHEHRVAEHEHDSFFNCGLCFAFDLCGAADRVLLCTAPGRVSGGGRFFAVGGIVRRS